PEPDLSYGLTTNMSWGAFSLYSFFQGTSGNAVYNGNLRLFSGGAAGRNIYRDAWLNRWTPENPSSEWPAFFREPGTGWNAPGGDRHADAYVEDGSYLRLKNVSLAYDIPNSVSERFVGMQSARIYLNADN